MKAFRCRANVEKAILAKDAVGPHSHEEADDDSEPWRFVEPGSGRLEAANIAERYKHAVRLPALLLRHPNPIR
jgi:hypothetical protein